MKSKGAVAAGLLRALPVPVTLLAYAYSIRLPFYLDDIPHFAIIRNFASGGLESLWFFWGGNSVYPYYRPVTFTVWQVSRRLAGHFDPVGLHLFNVLLYGMTALIVGLIVRRLAPSQKTAAGLVGGIGFALYPFSYQAVTLVGALAHLALAFGVAFCVYFAMLWMDGRGTGALVLCWIGAIIGVFSHENSILLLPLLAVLIAVRSGFRAVWGRRAQWILAPVTLITSVYLLVWFSIPRASGLTLYGDTFIESMATLVQGLIYPLSAALRPLVAGRASDGLMFTLAAGVVLGTGLWLRRTSRGSLSRAGYGLLWYGLGIVPTALLLSASYVSGSPRLTLFPAAGAAIFWGVLAAMVWDGKPYRLWRLGLVVVIVTALVITTNFLRLRYHEFERMSAYFWRLVTLVGEQEPPRLLLVNAPNYIAASEAKRVFLRGDEGVAFVADFVDYPHLFWVHNEARDYDSLKIEAVTVDRIKRYAGDPLFTHQPTLDDAQAIERAREATHIYVTYFDGDDFRPVYVGGAGMAGADTPVVEFGDGEIALTQAEFIFSPASQTVTVLTRWRVDQPAAVKPGVYVFCDGEMVGQLDGSVWGELYPFSAWRPGEIQTDLREIRLARSVTSDCLRVYTAVYQEADGLRWSARSTLSGERLPDDLAPVAMTGMSDDLFPFGA